MFVCAYCYRESEGSGKMTALVQRHSYVSTVIRMPPARWGEMEIPAARDGNALYVPVAYVCETVLGIDKRAQADAIKERYVEGTEWRGEVPFRFAGHLRMMLAIRAPEAALWIAGIDYRRVKNKATREGLAEFCEDLKREATRLLFGVAPRAPERLRGTASSAEVRIALTMACEECGAEHDITYADGVWTVTLRRAADV